MGPTRAETVPPTVLHGKLILEDVLQSMESVMSLENSINASISTTVKSSLYS